MGEEFAGYLVDRSSSESSSLEDTRVKVARALVSVNCVEVIASLKTNGNHFKIQISESYRCHWRCFSHRSLFTFGGIPFFASAKPYYDVIEEASPVDQKDILNFVQSAKNVLTRQLGWNECWKWSRSVRCLHSRMIQCRWIHPLIVSSPFQLSTRQVTSNLQLSDKHTTQKVRQISFISSTTKSTSEHGCQLLRTEKKSVSFPGTELLKPNDLL